MQKSIKISAASIAGIVFLLLLLIAVRIFQERLFYDPFLDFFKGENSKGKPLPAINDVWLVVSLLFRYVLNSLLSLGVIWLFFRDLSIIKLCAILYAILFVVLTVAFFIVLNSEDVNVLVLFYIRRFLIQPLFLILFIPAFYYQRKV